MSRCSRGVAGLQVGPLTRAAGSPGLPRAFTLIELLVVVAIMALLISILLPSLARARTQAKLTVDKANAKEVAHMIMEYQADYRGYVPIMYNYYAYGVGEYDAPARACWLSVALRDYHPRTARLKERSRGKYDPELCWYGSTNLKNQYENTYMPDFYVCPFARGQGDGRTMVKEDTFFRYYSWIGKHDLYQTCAWAIKRGTAGSGQPWPGGQGPSQRGIARFGTLSWNTIPSGATTATANKTEYKTALHRNWSGADARKVNGASLSDVTIVFCAQGEHNVRHNKADGVYKYGRANVGSHPGSGGGGTNVILADGHVEWVLGSRIGWP